MFIVNVHMMIINLEWKEEYNMTIIYMEKTLNLLAAQDFDMVKSLISAGVVKSGECGNYLVIETKEKEQI